MAKTKRAARKPSVTTVAKTAKKIAALLVKHPKGERKLVIKDANSTLRMVEKLIGDAKA